MTRLGGWARIGIVLSGLWALVVFTDLWIEKKEGPFSWGLVTQTIVSKTGEKASVLAGNEFRDAVPVDQVMDVRAFLLTLVLPILVMWLAGLTFAWIRDGFRINRAKQ